MSVYDETREIDVFVDINYVEFATIVVYDYNIDSTANNIIKATVIPDGDFEPIDITYIVNTVMDMRFAVIESINEKIYKLKRKW